MKAVWRFYSFRMLIGALFFDGIALGKVPLTNTALVLGVMLLGLAFGLVFALATTPRDE